MKEADFQKSIVIPELTKVPFLVVYCIQNESSISSVGLGIKRKQMGIRKGISDIVVFDLKHKVIDWLELKTFHFGKKGNILNKGKQSKEQVEFEGYCDIIGSEYYLINNPYDLENYLALKGVKYKYEKE